jgi:phage-related protein
MITQLVSGLVSGLPEMISAAGELVNSLVNSFITLAPQILSAGVQLIVNLVQGISQSLPDIVASATEVFQQLLTTLLEHLPELITTGIQLVGELAAGLLQALPNIVSAAVTLMAGVVDAILKVDWIKVGVDIIKAIIKGLESMAGEILQALMDIFGKAWEGIKNMFKGGGDKKKGKNSSSSVSSISSISDIDSAPTEVRNVLLNVREDDTEKVKNSDLTARLDAMLALMMRYYPDMAEKITIGGYADVDMIDRDLGMAVM